MSKHTNPLPLRTKMSQGLQIAGMSQRTHDGYLREVRKLACHFKLSPDQITEAQLREYFLYLKNDCQFAPGSLRVAFSGIKFFYTHTVPRDWKVLKKLRIPKQKTLPDVLTIDEVHKLIDAVSNPRIDLDMVRWLVWLFLGWTYWLGSGHAPPEKVEPKPVRCAACGSSMRIVTVVNVDCRVLVEHSLDYLDSG